MKVGDLVRLRPLLDSKEDPGLVLEVIEKEGQLCHVLFPDGPAWYWDNELEELDWERDE